MEIETIEQWFGRAVALACDMYGRGFQARVCLLTGANSANLNRIIKKQSGCSEEMRRKIVVAINQLIPNFPAKTYEAFLYLGRWASEGKRVEDLKALPGPQDHPATPCQTIEETVQAVQIGQLLGDGNIISPSSTGSITPNQPDRTDLHPHEQKFIQDMRRYGNLDMWERFLAEVERKKNAR